MKVLSAYWRFAPVVALCTLEVERLVLTACLTCSWVHEFLGTCPRSSETWRRLRGEFGGERNPRHGLLTPNDWSGVFNGSAGLHRYQGEPRFTFLLLNVTDGCGNVVHTDFESLLGANRLQDFSGNSVYLNLQGSRSVSGRHPRRSRQTPPPSPIDGSRTALRGRAVSCRPAACQQFR